MTDAISPLSDSESDELTSSVSFMILREAPEHPDIAELLEAGAEFCSNLQPPHVNFLINVTELQADGVHVYVARELKASGQSRALGMAALVPIYASLELGKAVEIKRLFVHATARRRGVAKALIKSIEKDALRGGYNRVMLETGCNLVEARNLYEKLGYTYIERFGSYKTSVQSVCMQMRLSVEADAGHDRDSTSVRYSPLSSVVHRMTSR
jgi:putative acetyltransferase